MLKKMAKRASAVIRNPRKVTTLALKQPYIMARSGPLEYGRYVKRGLGKQIRTHNFPNGIITSFDISKAKNWHMLNKRALVIVLVGDELAVEHHDRFKEQLLEIHRKLYAHYLVAPKLAESLGLHDEKRKPAEQIYSAYEYLANGKKIQLAQLQQDLIRTHYGNDVLLLNVQDEFPDYGKLLRLQHVAHTYNKDAGIASPALINRKTGKTVCGIDYNRAKGRFQPSITDGHDYGQDQIPRYNLSAYTHGLYITAKVLSRNQLSSNELADCGEFSQQVSCWIASAWQKNIRTLTFPTVALEVDDLPKMQMTQLHKQWLLNRNVRDADDKIRVIYVLNATSVSGGIRAVFEHINGLKERGFSVELWALQKQPTWTDLHVQVKYFASYHDLEIALQNEEAFKVATWWETGQPVWIASVNKGLPVFFIQEFETWFYPDDPLAQSAVVSSYRPEFLPITIAQYTADELAEIGVRAQLIPDGFETSLYHRLAGVVREKDTVLALGRSFFQKNFLMTLAGWKLLGANRPNLLLFGSEPDIAHDPKITYVTRPSNEDVNMLYNKATVFVQTSRHEGLCLPILEAMAAGCPVITTDSHGNRDFSIDEETCLIVEQDDVEGVAKAIERIVGNTKLQEKLRKNGLAMAKRYESDVILDDVRLFYETNAKNFSA